MAILDFKRFSQAVSAGGTTGSGRANLDGQNYQLKPSLRDNPSFFRRQMALFKRPKKILDYENLAEFIASRMATKLLNDPNNQKVPEVSFVVSDDDYKVKVASKYLPDFKELLHDKDTQFLMPNSVKNDNEGKRLTQEQVSQVTDAIALSILFKDHDINPQNISNDGRRIDFGHAFNETLSLPKQAGGGVRNKTNEVLDYLNREELPSSTGAKSSKLWRSYEELVVTTEMANSLEKTANLAVEKNAEAIDFAKKGFMELMNDFDTKLRALAKEKELTRDDHKARDAITMKMNALQQEKAYQIESLVAINTNLGGPEIYINLSEPQEAINRAFQTIANDHNKQAQDMQKAAELMNIQIMLKDKVKNKQPISYEEIQLLQEELKSLGCCDDKGKVTWIKNKKNEPAFTGTIQEFILHNAKAYGLSKEAISKIEPNMEPVTKRELVMEYMKKNSTPPVSRVSNVINHNNKRKHAVLSI